MNALENWFCATAYWRYITQNKLLPWMISDSVLGDHVLELGSGPGAGTAELRRRTPRVTSLEYSHVFAARLAGRQRNTDAVLQGDAAALPFGDRTFSAAVAILTLHHLRSCQIQKRAFSEIHRVLRPGGVLLAFEIPDGWMWRGIHRHSTFVPVSPQSVSGLLTAAGFAGVGVDTRFGGFRMRAQRARDLWVGE